MAISLGQTGTSDSIDAEYFNWESSDLRFMIHMHLDAIDGLARDLIERMPGEVGGILLGQVGRGERPVVWIERYQRIELSRHSEPNFVLSAEDHAAFENAARSLSENGELTVVGYYRSHMRAGFQLEEPDRELIARYFADPEDLVLLLRPEKNKVDILAQFFGRQAEPGGGYAVLGPAFPFRGRVVGLLENQPDADEDPEEQTARTVPGPPGSPPPPAAAHRRLVPDFQPAPEAPRPAREFFMEARPLPGAAAADPEPAGGTRFPGRWWPLLAAVLLVGTAAAVMVTEASRRHETAPARPLGLYVDPSGQNWRVSWNTSATDAPGDRVSLFVRDGDQNQIQLQPENLESGTYFYPAKGRDVTFRLEVADKGGHVSAESFRLISPPPTVAAVPPAPAPPEKQTALAKPENRFTPPKAIHRVPPVVPASVRPRIHGSIPLDVRVKVDAHGKVISAVPASKVRSGVETLLASRAVYAARQWRFEPARQDGKAVPGSEIIHFVFDK